MPVLWTLRAFLQAAVHGFAYTVRQEGLEQGWLLAWAVGE